MGNTARVPRELKLVRFEASLSPPIRCNSCDQFLKDGDICKYSCREYWHICCQSAGEDSCES